MVDMAFFVDSSGSIHRNNWKKMKDFVSQTIALVMKEHSGNRFALVAYSSGADVVFDFNKLGDGATHSDYDKLVQGMRHQKGLTFIDKSLLLGNSRIFTTAGGMRGNVAKVIYLS